MTRKLQILRGTTAQNNAYTGAVGELTMDTDRNEVRIHDGQTVGGIKIGDRNMPILTSMFFDHIINDISWLRADTFSWHSGETYKAAYEHLVNDVGEVWYAWAEIGGGIWYTKTPTVSVGDTVYNDDFSVYGTVSTASSSTNFTVGASDFNRSSADDIPAHKTDTIGDITITYYLAEDGHKICLPDQESNLVALYEATGVAWYYLLDTENKQFKLPRTKFGFTGLRDSVGGYVAPGLPNITGTASNLGSGLSHTYSGAFYEAGSASGAFLAGSGGNHISLGIDASISDTIYGNSDTVQPPATQMYLYFYVGNFTQEAIEQTAGITTETLNGKADTDLGNITSTGKETVVGWGLPDYNNPISIGTFNSSNPYTAPKAGFFYCAKATGLTLYVNGAEAYYGGTSSGATSAWGATVFVSKGDIITTDASSTARPTFYPLKGVA